MAIEKQLKQQLVEALANFIIRVSEGKTTSEAEIAVLPEVVNALVNLANDGRSY